MKISCTRKDQHTLVSLIFIIISLFGILPLQAAIFTVTKFEDSADGECSADCSLREAIIAANSLVGHDTVFVPGGQYVISITGADEDAGAAGDLDIVDSVTIEVFYNTQNGMSEAHISDAMGADDRLLHIHGSAGDVLISNIDVPGIGAFSNAQGGCIYNAANTTMNSSVLIGCSANQGGGIYNVGTMFLNDVRIDSHASSKGLAIYNEGNIELSGCHVQSMVYDTDAPVGIVYNLGVMMVEMSGFVGGDWGLINDSSASLTLSKVYLGGHGIAFGGGILNQGTTSVTNSILSGNNSIAQTGVSTISNSGTFNLLNSTVVENSDGVIYNTGSIHFANSIVWESAGIVCSGNGTFTSNEHNIVAADCGLQGGADINSDPGLTPLIYWGNDAVPSYALFGSSPAIDAGVPGDCPATDIRGTARPQDGDLDAIAECDIGAFETEEQRADIEIALSATPNPAPVGTEVTFTYVINNSGPDDSGPMAFYLDWFNNTFFHPQFAGYETFGDIGASFCDGVNCRRAFWQFELPVAGTGGINIRMVNISGGLLSSGAKLYGSRIDPDEDYNTELVSAQITGAAGIDISPLDPDFGDVEVGDSLSTEFSIYNRGDQELELSGITLRESSDVTSFTLDTTTGPQACGSDTPVIPPVGLCTIVVTFKPVVSHLTTGYLDIESNDPGGTAFLSFSGTGFELETGNGDGGNCFIATAAYGSYLHEDVKVLRQFRDDVLLNHTWGRIFVERYYQYSPRMANLIDQHESLKLVTRLLLLPIILFLKYPYATLIVTVFTILLFNAWRGKRRIISKSFEI